MSICTISPFFEPIRILWNNSGREDSYTVQLIPDVQSAKKCQKSKEEYPDSWLIGELWHRNLQVSIIHLYYLLGFWKYQTIRNFTVWIFKGSFVHYFTWKLAVSMKEDKTKLKTMKTRYFYSTFESLATEAYSIWKREIVSHVFEILVLTLGLNWNFRLALIRNTERQQTQNLFNSFSSIHIHTPPKVISYRISHTVPQSERHFFSQSPLQASY